MATQSTHTDLHYSGFLAEWSAFWGMVKKELIVMTRYPVQFFTSFAQVFLIILVFSLAAAMFDTPGESAADQYDSGVAAYGFIIFMFFSDSLWTIGAVLRQEQGLSVKNEQVTRKTAQRGELREKQQKLAA
ncbi:MAG: hypothetical protein JXB15_04015, partial [Anaerolineales bacterium]|nr:hypothetical protein [Anaerolineales bacterium]